nr:MAG TPA: hypothetical protein [Caudoviricetes sp.]
MGRFHWAPRPAAGRKGCSPRGGLKDTRDIGVRTGATADNQQKTLDPNGAGGVPFTPPYRLHRRSGFHSSFFSPGSSKEVLLWRQKKKRRKLSETRS